MNPYREVLSQPGALCFSAAAFVGRMQMSMFSLGTVLLISSITGRYGLAGTVAATAALGYAICAPQAARLADRFGQHRVLRPLAIFFAVNTITFVACAEFRAPLGVLLVTGALAGACMPSLGSMVRARWIVLLADPGQLHTAFSLESVADEIIFVIGPAAVTLLATQVQPAAGVAAAMMLGVTGTLLLAAQRRSEPPPRAPAEASTAPARRLAVPARALITLVPVYVCGGAMLAAIDLSTVDFAQEHGHKPLAGVILGVYALGSAVGGLWYGSRAWTVPLERRFAVALCCSVAGAATLWAQPGLLALTAVMLVAGLTFSPTVISGYGLVERQAPAQRRTEGMAWLSSGISVGVACGSAGAGHFIDAGGARGGYAFAAGCGAAAACACLLGMDRLRVARPAVLRAVPPAE